MQKGEPTWEELKEFGAGWWITNINILKRTMEKVSLSSANIYVIISSMAFKLAFYGTILVTLI